MGIKELLGSQDSKSFPEFQMTSTTTAHDIIIWLLTYIDDPGISNSNRENSLSRLKDILIKLEIHAKQSVKADYPYIPRDPKTSLQFFQINWRFFTAASPIPSIRSLVQSRSFVSSPLNLRSPNPYQCRGMRSYFRFGLSIGILRFLRTRL